MTALKFEGKFKVGDRIRAFDFRSSEEHYIEGVIKETGWVNEGSFKAFTIDIDDDPQGGRVGQVGLVPMGISILDYDSRIVKIHTCPSCGTIKKCEITNLSGGYFSGGYCGNGCHETNCRIEQCDDANCPHFICDGCLQSMTLSDPTGQKSFENRDGYPEDYQ